MADEPQEEPTPNPRPTEEPPPFDPDPRLVTFLERGRKPGEEIEFRRLDRDD